MAVKLKSRVPEPSVANDPLAKLTEPTTGSVDVSLIVNVSVATIVPLVLPVLNCMVAVSDPSVVESAVGVTLKLPLPSASIVTVPDDAPKSPDGVTVQYSVVPELTFVVPTFIVPGEPSSIEVGAVTL